MTELLVGSEMSIHFQLAVRFWGRTELLCPP
jgi:hypothetical protein